MRTRAEYRVDCFRLARARLDAGLTIRKAARLIGVSRNMVVRWENNYAHPSRESLKRICEVYGVDLEDLK